MKIGILNMQYSRHNYGALLQAAVLEHIVRDLLPNAQVEHIDARPVWLKNSWKRWASSYVKSLVEGLLGRFVQIPRIGNYEVFSDFRNKYLQLSDKTYFEYTDFVNETWEYDYVIVGSDQVFRIKFVKERVPIFFLRFLNISCILIAYAASFGVDQWEAADDLQLTKEISEDLKKFTAISVRESSGINICQDWLGVDAIHVLDPTLLVGREFFDQIIERSELKEFFSDWSVHFISNDAEFTELLPELAKKNGKILKDIYFERSYIWPLPAKVKFSSIPEWLLKIRQTNDIILTDSFHCVCLCIVYEKEFLVFLSKKNGVGRMFSLLNMLGLSSRICNKDVDLLDIINNKSRIDYLNVNNKIKSFKAKSIHFILNSFQSDK